MQHRVLVAAAVAFVVAAVASGTLVAHVSGGAARAAGPHEDPGAFVSGVVTLIVGDRYGEAWTSLNSAHKLVAPRNEYVACEQQSPVNAKLHSIDIVRVADRALRIPGATTAVPVKSVTLRIDLTSAAIGRETFRHTFNVVADGAHWTWILTPSRYELYRSNGC